MNILYAEDEPKVAQSVKKGLEAEGFTVELAFDGTIAEKMFERQDHDFIILDINLPGRNGMELCRSFRKRNQRVPILMLTAKDMTEDKVAGLDSGADDYIVKPFQKSDLIPAIEVAIGRFRELSALAGEVGRLEDQLETRKIMDRAKGILMDECGLSEGDAFTFIQRGAMSQRSRMRDIADQIIAGTLRP